MGVWKKCKNCGTEFLGPGKCCSDACAERAARESVIQLKARKGPIYEKWKRNLKASLKRL